jgi:hypothetical protein
MGRPICIQAMEARYLVVLIAPAIKEVSSQLVVRLVVTL